MFYAFVENPQDSLCDHCFHKPLNAVNLLRKINEEITYPEFKVMGSL